MRELELELSKASSLGKGKKNGTATFRGILLRMRDNLGPILEYWCYIRINMDA